MPLINVTPMDNKNMYELRNYTDNKSGNIIRAIPVDDKGYPDPTRAEAFMGETMLQSNQGPFPVKFPIKAQTLDQAIDMFTNSVSEVVEKMSEEATRRALLDGGKNGMPQPASKIIKPN